ncbi:hypothetical protein [Mesorhizobium sp.]|uniref:hypothetical protein n=1 Tax=Mesorhizobium sp. TaxID=1871066 RepID=UPI001212486A|nr:hypothetical protein [Mesorhizobium sp.]TIO62925.1 MAG: hypothetical protein E5X79_01260 [Mesorhizobium sp.]
MDIAVIMDRFLADNPGPVSIVAGIAALRSHGIILDDVEAQNLIGTFAAERRRAIRFDRLS